MRTSWNRSAKEIAYIAVFVALLITSQLLLSFVSGVEIVTVLFVSYSFVFGVKRGIIAGVVFTLLRQLIFNFIPSVMVTYLLYYPLLSVCFGSLGKKKEKMKSVWIVVVACICTACFTLIDDCITPFWYGLDKNATITYFYSSLIVMAMQVLCTAITVSLLFPRLKKTFELLKSRL